MGTFFSLIKKYKFSGFKTFVNLKIGFTSDIRLNGLLYGIALRPNSSDIATFKHIFAHGDYDFEIDCKPRVIVDAGSNIGLASIYFTNKYPEAEIIAVELAPSNFRILEKNISNYKNIKAVNAGLWHKNETLKFKEEGASPWGYRVQNQLIKQSIEIQSITMNDIIKTYGLRQIDILKIDIEGAEVELFSENFEFWLPKVNYLVIETHDRFRPESTSTVTKALSKFDFIRLPEVGENLVFKNNQF